MFQSALELIGCTVHYVVVIIQATTDLTDDTRAELIRVSVESRVN